MAKKNVQAHCTRECNGAKLVTGATLQHWNAGAGEKSKYWICRPKQATTGADGAFLEAQLKLQLKLMDAPMQGSSDARAMDPWIRSTGWRALIDSTGLSTQLLKRLVLPPKIRTWEKLLAVAVLSYVRLSLAQCMEDLELQKLNSPRPSASVLFICRVTCRSPRWYRPSNTPFGRVQEASTLIKYSLQATKVILMMARCHEEGIEIAPVSDALAQDCQELVDRLKKDFAQRPDPGRSVDQDVEKGLAAMDDIGDDDDADVIPEDIILEDIQSLGPMDSNEEEFTVPSEDSASLNVPYEQLDLPVGDEYDTHVHRIFMGLWKTESPRDGLKDPTEWCLALGALAPDGTFQHPKVTTSPLAALTFIIRCAFKLEALRLASQSGSSGRHSHKEAEAMNVLQPYYTEKHYTIFEKIRSLQRRATSYTLSTPSLPQSCWVGDDILMFKGVRIDFHDYKKMLAYFQDEPYRLFRTQLCFDKAAITDVVHADLADTFGDRAEGYSMFQDERNESSFQNVDDGVILKVIDRDPELKGRFYTRNGDTFLWVKPELEKWLRCLADVELFALLCAMMLTGAPARGTELTAMLFCNTMDRLRNFFAVGPHLTLVRMYTKMTATMGDRCIPAALDAFSAALATQIFKVARPFAVFAANICFPGDKGIQTLYRSQMYMGYGRKFTTEDISQRLMDVSPMFLRTDAKLGVRAYRQIMTSFYYRYSQESFKLMDEVDGNVSLHAQQAGHSKRVELTHYGNTSHSLLGPEVYMAALIECSRQWQRICSVPPGSSLVISW
jgi:hypothetical protein